MTNLDDYKLATPPDNFYEYDFNAGATKEEARIMLERAIQKVQDIETIDLKKYEGKEGQKLRMRDFIRWEKVRMRIERYYNNK